jgi:hypothetical protein
MILTRVVNSATVGDRYDQAAIRGLISETSAACYNQAQITSLGEPGCHIQN